MCVCVCAQSDLKQLHGICYDTEYPQRCWCVRAHALVCVRDSQSNLKPLHSVCYDTIHLQLSLSLCVCARA